MIVERGLDVDIEVDGGIGPATVAGAAAGPAPTCWSPARALFRDPDGLEPRGHRAARAGRGRPRWPRHRRGRPAAPTARRDRRGRLSDRASGAPTRRHAGDRRRLLRSAPVADRGRGRAGGASPLDLLPADRAPRPVARGATAPTIARRPGPRATPGHRRRRADPAAACASSRRAAEVAPSEIAGPDRGRLVGLRRRARRRSTRPAPSEADDRAALRRRRAPAPDRRAADRGRRGHAAWSRLRPHTARVRGLDVTRP